MAFGPPDQAIIIFYLVNRYQGTHTWPKSDSFIPLKWEMQENSYLTGKCFSNTCLMEFQGQNIFIR